MASPPIGLFGGSFDPVHNAHLAIAHSALTLLGLGQVLWLPSGVPPHRAAPQAGALARLAMLRLALAGEVRFAIDPRELAKTTPAYTVDTLLELRSELGVEPALVLLMGGDQFARLATWHRWLELFALAHLAVFTRAGWALDASAPEALRQQQSRRRCAPASDWRSRSAGSVIEVPMSPLAISSSEVRARIARGEMPRDLAPPAVLEYISSHALYGHS